MDPIPEPRRKLKIFVQSMDGAGHSNSCVGIAQALLRRGHQVFFLMNEAMAGQFKKYGFDEILLKKTSAPAEQQGKNPIKMFAELVQRTGLLDDIPPLEKLKGHYNSEESFLNVICKTLTDFNLQIEQAIQREQPDVIIVAQFLVPPAIAAQTSIPMVYLFPCNPIGLYVSPKVPPFFSGFPIDSDPATWEEFRHFQQTEYLGAFRQFQDKLNAACNYQPPVEESVNLQRSHFLRSKHLNIYGYPLELDYCDVAPAPENSARVDAFCREEPTDVPFELPSGFYDPSVDKLIFFSMGSMGSINIPLMKRILSVLAKTPYKYIVSKGPLADEYELSANCWGQAYLPQTRILPLVDLVITHGGNNTVTETFCFGKPMILLPLFSDQYDNSQRVHEKGFGTRLATHRFTDQELLDAIEKLLNDKELHQRLAAAVKRIKEDRSKERVCVRIEEIAEKCAEERKNA